MAGTFIMSFTTAGAVSVSFFDSKGNDGQGLATGPDGALWYVNPVFGFIDQVTTSLFSGECHHSSERPDRRPRYADSQIRRWQRHQQRRNDCRPIANSAIRARTC